MERKYREQVGFLGAFLWRDVGRRYFVIGAAIVVIVLVDNEKEFGFLFGFRRGGAYPGDAAQFALEGGCVYGRVMARVRSDDDVGVGGLPVCLFVCQQNPYFVFAPVHK